MEPRDAQVANALLDVDARMRRREPYDALMEALDACRRMPGGAVMAGAIAMRRLAVAQVYQQGDEEIARILADALPLLRASEPVASWVTTVAATCMRRPSIAGHFVPSALAELRAHLDQYPNQAEEALYQSLRAGYEQTMASGT